MENNKTLVLIDSNAIIHRAYHALPKNMKTSTGQLTNVVYGYTTTLIKVLEDLKPTHIAASFDISKATFRVAEYAKYKAHRVAADQELYDQIPYVRELLEVLNIPIYELEGFEADDCIGTITDMFEEKNPNQKFQNFNVYIVTGDKDAFQLIDGNIFVYNLKHGLQSGQIVDRDVITKEWNLQPEDFIDLKALAGDPSDNIPGVPGIGPKTATDLLIKFDTLVKLYAQIEALLKTYNTNNHPIDQLHHDLLDQIASDLAIKPRTVRLLLENKDQAFLSQRLATIRRDVPLDFDLEDCQWGDYDKDKAKDFFEKMQFTSLLRRFGVVSTDGPKPKVTEKQKDKDEQLKLL